MTKSAVIYFMNLFIYITNNDFGVEFRKGNNQLFYAHLSLIT